VATESAESGDKLSEVQLPNAEGESTDDASIRTTKVDAIAAVRAKRHRGFVAVFEIPLIFYDRPREPAGEASYPIKDRSPVSARKGGQTHYMFPEPVVARLQWTAQNECPETKLVDLTGDRG
jgi:hypothetical protein